MINATKDEAPMSDSLCSDNSIEGVRMKIQQIVHGQSYNCNRVSRVGEYTCESSCTCPTSDCMQTMCAACCRTLITVDTVLYASHWYYYVATTEAACIASCFTSH